MTTTDIAFVCLAVGAFGLFGLVLAWASWQESRAAAAKDASTKAPRNQDVSHGVTKARAS